MTPSLEYVTPELVGAPSHEYLSGVSECRKFPMVYYYGDQLALNMAPSREYPPSLL